MPTAKFILKTDFDAEPYKLSKNKFTKDDLQGRIDLWEYKYLRRILGDRILTALFADLTGSVPNHPKYLALLNGATYINCEGETVIYEGLKEPLKFIIHALILSKTNYVHTIVGMTQADTENSMTLSKGGVSALYRDSFNQGTEMARGVNYFIMNYERYRVLAASIVLSSGITYTVSLTDTKYLKNGDTITIDGVDYVIANLVDNTSFEIDSATDISNGSLYVKWDIFGDYDVTPLNYTFLNR